MAVCHCVSMNLLLRIIEVIVPVFFTVALGYLYARRHQPDMKTFNHVALDVCVPLLTYSALASSSFHLQEHSLLLLGGALTVAGAGLLAWPLAELPLSCDALVLTPSEHAELLASGSAMAAALERDSRWLWHR